MLERSERIVVTLALSFTLTLALTRWLDGVAAWLVWAIVWVVLAGSVLVALNRDPPPE